MQISPYLNFNGDCAEAFKFYAKVLGGEIIMMMTHAETPAAEHTSPEWQDKIIHARIKIGEQYLMASDAPPQFASKPAGFSVSIVVDTPEEAERIFAALMEDGDQRMPIGETFWALRFGMGIDRFGTPWMVNCERPQA